MSAPHDVIRTPGARVKLLARASGIARRYCITIQRDPDRGFRGASLEMPHVTANARTVRACASRTLDAITGAVAVQLRRGKRPPSPAGEGRRDRRLKVRLFAHEIARIESAAQRAGFRSVSDFVRFAALAKAG